MAEASNTACPRHQHFWAGDSVAGLVILGLSSLAAYPFFPRPVRHPAIRKIIGKSSYVGHRPYEVGIGPDQGEYRLEIELPDGAKGAAFVWLETEVHWAREFLRVVVHQNVWQNDPRMVKELRIDHEDIQLTDSEGHTFTILPGRLDDRDSWVFEVREEEVFERVRFNDPNYHLSLTVSFDLRGPRVMRIGRLMPTVRFPVKGHHDTPGPAIVMLAMMALVVFGLPVSALLLGRAALRWRRGRSASADA